MQAGISLADLCEELDQRGLALENMGDIAYQSIAGATATATHGTGWHFGNISSRIVGMRLIAGDGTIVEATADENPEVLAAARVGVGALGIVSTVTLQTVRAFRLHAIEEPMRVDEILSDFDGYMSSADHVEFYWVPHTGWALTKRNRRTDEAPAPRGKAKEVYDDLVLGNLGFGAMCRVGRWKPEWIPRLAKILPSTGRLEYTDRSDRVFTSPRRVKFYEMEYAIPRDDVPEALTRVRRLVDELGMQLSFPVEVRVVAPDDIPLSTAEGRATGYIAVHVYQGPPTTPTSRASSASWTPTAADPTGGRCTSRATRRSPSATRGGTSSRPSAVGSIPRAGSRTSTSSACSARSPRSALLGRTLRVDEGFGAPEFGLNITLCGWTLTEGYFLY